MVISAIGSLNSSVLSGARVPYAMARDGIFFKIADGIHPKFLTPARALIFQGVPGRTDGAHRNVRRADKLIYFCRVDFLWAGCGGAVPIAQNGTGHAASVSLLGISMGARNIRRWALLLTINILLQRPGRSLIGLLLIAAGLPFYRYWNRSVSAARDLTWCLTAGKQNIAPASRPLAVPALERQPTRKAPRKMPE